jgi:hypothetical protein
LRHYPEEETAVRLPIAKFSVRYLASISLKIAGPYNFLLHFFKKSEVQGLVNGYGSVVVGLTVRFPQERREIR